ncbi:shikimate kinase [Pseudalkalibacillus hwajinpoensis]|uniref:Shikimate kinase n=1 Tax=Guptibacillus hwajinpoensis TaxID=208199 RepID=A0A4U1MH97_9BACL|nr:shikimate kinase [Pseudalkalibacillus hwajinpoensis]TKD70091.1 shikimate kinase [Pseudalkalibacillus hwajinpoensis]
MKAIYLTGFMGSGKTTVAEKLSFELAVPAIDTDHQVEEVTGKAIPDIFSSEGEEAFRKYETESLKTIPNKNVVISTGGGIILKKQNREFMRKHGTVIYLHCEPEEILKRLEGDSSRPLLSGENRQAKIQSIFSERLPLYREAHFEIDTTNRSVSEIANEIQGFIG